MARGSELEQMVAEPPFDPVELEEEPRRGVGEGRCIGFGKGEATFFVAEVTENTGGAQMVATRYGAEVERVGAGNRIAVAVQNVESCGVIITVIRIED